MKTLTYYQCRYRYYDYYDRVHNLPDPLGYLYLKKKNAERRKKELHIELNSSSGYVYIDEVYLVFADGVQ